MEVLSLNLEIEEPSDFIEGFDATSLEDAHEALLEAFKVPVLIDAGVDDARVEHLLGLLCEEIAQVLHIVDLVVVLQVLSHKVGEQLLG